MRFPPREGFDLQKLAIHCKTDYQQIDFSPAKRNQTPKQP